MTQTTETRPKAAGVRSGTTKLSRSLHGHGEDADRGPVAAFRHARRTFLAGQRIDMGALATAMQVDRATLFRWLGNRDQLIEEIIWSFAEPAWQRAVAASSGSGAGFVVEVLSRWMESITAPDADYFHAYLRREPARALRLLTTRDGLHQQRVVDLIEHLIDDQLVAAGVQLPVPGHDLAYAVTRLAESFIYSDVITGETPDAGKAAAVIGAVLGVTPPARTQRGGRPQ